jgi:hypothetical protein
MPTVYDRDQEPYGPASGHDTGALTPPTPISRELAAPDDLAVRDPIAGEVVTPHAYEDDRPTDPVERQQEVYGGLKPGAAFFGWLSAQSLAALVLAVGGGAAAALGVTSTLETLAEDEPLRAVLTVGGLALALVALVAYAGGYVAGRMSRFDGGRQGAGVWVLGLLTAAGLAGSVVLLDPDLPVPGVLETLAGAADEGRARLVALGLVAAAALLALGAAVVGGKVGVRYHRMIDLAGEDSWDDQP